MDVVVANNSAILEQEMNKLTAVDIDTNNNKKDNNVAAFSKLKEAAAAANVVSSETENIDGTENSVPAEPLTSKKKFSKKRNEKFSSRIQVSNTKKPLFFYLNLAKWQLKKHMYVELSALGMAIPTAILISEILKRNGQAIEKKIMTFLVNSKEEENGHLIQKSKIMIVLEKDNKYPKTAAADEAVKPSEDGANIEI